MLMEDKSPAKGVIHAFMHRGDVPIKKIGTEDKQGYIDREKFTDIVREMVVDNLIVNKASEFVAKRLRPGNSWGKGINYLELGTGVGTGTPQNPQPESATQTALRTPLERIEVTSWTYIDSNGQPTSSETDTIEMTFVFEENQANDAIVEMGLFGGDATGTLGSGYMFNYKTFSVWNKDSTMKLTVTWRLRF